MIASATPHFGVQGVVARSALFRGSEGGPGKQRDVRFCMQLIIT